MSDEIDAPRGTSAHMPGLNWSQVRETVLMLELSAAQIEAAMKDSNSSMFDAVMQGMPVQEAGEKFMAEMKKKSDDIELF
jgi:phospholipid N-methyltransferase